MPTAPPDRLCRQLVETTADAVIVADGAGRIQLWNAGAEALFGYRAAEAVGQTLDLIVPERLRERHWAGYRRVMATGVTHYGRELLAVPAQRKDGTRLSVESSLALLRDEAGALRGAAAILRDVTERRLQEQALRERLATLEARGASAQA